MCALKKPLLDLPIKVILTEEGASHFISKKKKLLRFRLADNLEEYGIKFNSFAPISLQQMILVDYISKIEISSGICFFTTRNHGFIKTSCFFGFV